MFHRKVPSTDRPRWIVWVWKFESCNSNHGNGVHRASSFHSSTPSSPSFGLFHSCLCGVYFTCWKLHSRMSICVLVHSDKTKTSVRAAARPQSVVLCWCTGEWKKQKSWWSINFEINSIAETSPWGWNLLRSKLPIKIRRKLCTPTPIIGTEQLKTRVWSTFEVGPPNRLLPRIYCFCQTHNRLRALL